MDSNKDLSYPAIFFGWEKGTFGPFYVYLGPRYTEKGPNVPF